VQTALALERAAHDGVTESTIAKRFAPFCFRDERELARVLGELDRIGLPPFWRATIADRLRLLGREPESGLMVLPKTVAAPTPPETTAMRGFEGLAVVPGTTLTCPLPPRPFVVRGRCGIEPDAFGPSARGVAHFTIEVRAADGTVLDRRALDVDAIAARAEPRLFEFALELDERRDTSLTLRFDVDGLDAQARGFWSDVRLR
jgi:hypothetical protein